MPNVLPERLARHVHLSSRPTGENWTSPVLQAFSDVKVRRAGRAQVRRDGWVRDYTALRGDVGDDWHSDYDASSDTDN